MQLFCMQYRNEYSIDSSNNTNNNTTSNNNNNTSRNNQTTEGCFKVVLNNRKNWTDAEVVCKGYGKNVHLVTLNTQQAGSFMHSHINCGFF